MLHRPIRKLTAACVAMASLLSMPSESRAGRIWDCMFGSTPPSYTTARALRSPPVVTVPSCPSCSSCASCAAPACQPAPGCQSCQYAAGRVQRDITQPIIRRCRSIRQSAMDIRSDSSRLWATRRIARCSVGIIRVWFRTRPITRSIRPWFRTTATVLAPVALRAIVAVRAAAVRAAAVRAGIVAAR